MAAATAPMSGKIVSILVEVGEKVEDGQAVVVLEAMKMENDVVAPANGTVDKILVNVGQMVNGGDELVTLA